MNNSKYYIRLDVVRVLACIIVLLYHLGIIKGGFLAVCTFFALSGYLGCVSALKEKEFSIKEYYKSRIKKIYIPLLVVISITVIFSKLLINVNWLNLKQETVSSVFGYNNFWLLNANFDYFTKNMNTPFIHLWFISILMQFDLIFPLAFIGIKKLDEKVNNDFSIIIVFLLSVISTVIFFYMSKTQDIMTVYYNTIARSFSILWGVFLALVHQNFMFRFTQVLRKFDKVIFGIYSTILIIFCIFIPEKSNYYAYWMILTTFITVRLIKYATLKDDIKINGSGIIQIFSKISYEIYLVQYPIIFFMQKVDINYYIKVPLIIILTIIISAFLHFFLCYKFKRKNNIKIIFICLIILIGGIIVLNEKDHSDEMSELQSRLNENIKIAEQKNKEFLNKYIKNEKEWSIITEKDINEDIKKDEENTEIKQEENTSIEKTIEVKDEKFNKENTESNENKDNNKFDESKLVKDKLKTIPIVGIGDSVFLDAVDLLYKKFPNGYFDGKISRSLIGGKEVIVNLKNKGKLSNTVILALCTNGDYSDKRNKDIMQILGNREVFWINAVGADDPSFNDRFKKFAVNYPNIHIVDWETAAKNHPEYFYPDGIHAKGNGIKVYVDTIYNTIYNFYLEKYKNSKK